MGKREREVLLYRRCGGLEKIVADGEGGSSTGGARGRE